MATELTGQGRIQALVARASDSGASLGTSAWVDSRWGTKCVVYPDEDNNSYRCIPRNEPAQVSFNQFRDPDCSIPLAIPSACGDVHLVWDPSHDAVYEVQGVEQLTQAYSVVDGVCTAEAQAEFDNYVLSPLTLDDFVEFHEVIE